MSLPKLNVNSTASRTGMYMCAGDPTNNASSISAPGWRAWVGHAGRRGLCDRWCSKFNSNFRTLGGVCGHSGILGGRRTHSTRHGALGSCSGCKRGRGGVTIGAGDEGQLVGELRSSPTDKSGDCSRLPGGLTWVPTSSIGVGRNTIGAGAGKLVNKGGSGSTRLLMADSEGCRKGKTNSRKTALSEMISFLVVGSQNHQPL